MNLEHSIIELGADAPLNSEPVVATYEAPAIESVLTSADLEREVHYAGVQATSGGNMAVA